MKAQTGASQVSLMTRILHLHPHSGRPGMDPADRVHTGHCSVSTGTLAQSDCGIL